MVRYADETRDAFVSRVMKEKGFGTGRPTPMLRSKIEARSRDEILAEQIAAHDRRASGLFRFGPAEIWQRGDA